MQELYRQLKNRLKQIHFGAIWPEFHQFPFALYDAQQAVFQGETIAKPDAFIGNTALLWQGRHIAIWHIAGSPTQDLNNLTANLVHEMFHAFQLEQGETRFPDELCLARTAQTPRSMALKAREIHLLANGGALSKISALRQKRGKLLGSASKEEWRAETIEGMAEYAFLQAMEQLTGGTEAVQHKRQRLCHDTPSLLDIRRTAYDSGALLLSLAIENGVPIFHSIGQENRSIYELISPAMQPETPDPVTTEELLLWETMLRQQKQRQEAVLQQFLSSPRHMVQGTFTLQGFDPANLWRKDDVLYCSTFLSLLEENGKTVSLFDESVLYMLDTNHAWAYLHE